MAENEITVKLLDPYPPQVLFYKSHARYTCYGGSRGGGKSVAARQKAVLLALNYPGLQILLLRRSLPELRTNHLYPLQEMLRGVAQYRTEEKLFLFPNGSRLFLGYCDSEMDVLQYHGNQYEVIFMEEATHFTEYQFYKLTQSNRLSGLCKAKFTPRMYMTCNPGGVGHCVPYGDVLTTNGWVDIKDVKIGDSIYTVAADKSLEIETVTQTHHYIDKVNYVNVRGLHMALTDEHKVMTANGSLVKFCELPGQTIIARSVQWQGTPIGDVDIQSTIRRRTKQPDKISGNDFATLLGWYLSEGCLIDTDYRVSIAQSKPETKQKLIRFLEGAGFVTCSSPQDVCIYGYGLWSKLKSYNFGKCRDKYIPREIKNATTPELKLFMEAMVDGDGHWASKDSGQYYTISKRLADDMQEVLIKLGYVTSLHSRQRENREGLSYCVNFKKTKSGGTEILTGNHVYNVDTVTKRHSDISVGNKTDVYCIGVEKNHSFVIRQNGAVWVSGNCWVKRLFIDRNYKGKENPDDYVFIPSSVYDNKFLMENDPEYVHQLENLPDAERRAMLHGDWDVFEGQYFHEFDRAVHVIDPFTIPSHWRRYFTMDYGLDMLAGYFIAVDEQNRAYVYREIYEPNQIIRNAAKLILDSMAADEQNPDLFRESITSWYAPTDLWNKRQETGRSVADIFREHGITLTRTSNDRVAGWLTMKEWLSVFPDETGEPCARLRIFKTCTNLIRCIPMLQYDNRNASDVHDVRDIKDNNHELTHAPDAIRYFLNGRVRPAPPLPQTVITPQFASLRRNTQPRHEYGVGQEITEEYAYY